MYLHFPYLRFPVLAFSAPPSGGRAPGRWVRRQTSQVLNLHSNTFLPYRPQLNVAVRLHYAVHGYSQHKSDNRVYSNCKQNVTVISNHNWVFYGPFPYFRCGRPSAWRTLAIIIIIMNEYYYRAVEWWGAGMVICLEQGADLHMAQLMPLPLTVSCFSKIQIGFTLLVAAHLGSPRKRAVERVCVCLCVCACAYTVPSVL